VLFAEGHEALAIGETELDIDDAVLLAMTLWFDSVPADEDVMVDDFVIVVDVPIELELLTLLALKPATYPTSPDENVGVCGACFA